MFSFQVGMQQVAIFVAGGGCMRVDTWHTPRRSTMVDVWSVFIACHLVLFSNPPCPLPVFGSNWRFNQSDGDESGDKGLRFDST